MEMSGSGLYRMRFCDEGYSDWMREVLLQEDLQLLETTGLELKCTMEWARGKLKLFKALARRMREFLEALNVLDDVFKR